MEIILWVLAGIAIIFGFVVLFGAPYVPVLKKDLKRAFDELYVLSKDDVLVDLGSGDGKVLREVSRRGAHAVGYELNPLLVLFTQLLAWGDKKVRILPRNFWRVRLPDDVTIIYVFTVARDAGRLTKKLTREASRLKKPLYVLSYGFALPEIELVKKNGSHQLYLVKPLQVKKPQV